VSRGFWIHKLGLTLGAEVGGIDLRERDSDAFHLLREALLDHLVIVIRGQQLEAAGFLALARRFGKLEAHSQYHHPQHREILLPSERVEDDNANDPPDDGTAWQSEYSFRESPAKETLLYPLRVPPEGSTTLFANLYEPYAVLPDLLKRRIESLHAIHNFDYRRRRQVELQGIHAQIAQDPRDRARDVAHPVVRTHPETRRQSLYLNPGFVAGFTGMNEAESEALKDVLFSYCLRSAFHYAHRWRAGDVVIWDNRCTMHAASAGDAADAQRITFRCTVLGDKPYFIRG